MKEFPHYVSMPIEQVMADPDEFIIPENRRAIEYLWDMNIITQQTNDYENEDSWIALGMLSKENDKIITKMRNDMQFSDPQKPGILLHHGLGFRVPVKPGTKDTFDDFKPLFELLSMQDVERDGYMTLDEFYSRYTDCWKQIRNPYLELEPKIENYEDPREWLEASHDYYRKKYPQTPFVRVYDETKATKSLEEYLEAAEFLDCYDPEEQKVFLNRRLYEGHMRYKEYMHGRDESTLHHNR